MSINDFLADVEGSLTRSVICFTANRESCFLAHLASFVARSSGIAFTRLVGDSVETFDSCLRMYSFIGKTLFWCGNVAEEEIVRQVCVSACSQYSGPHIAAFFVPQEQVAKYERLASSQVLFVSCDVPLNEKLVHTLGSTLFSQVQHDNNVNWRLPSLATGTLTLDQLFCLLPYQALGNNCWEEVEKKWLERLVAQENSFYGLAQYFFVKNREQFVHAWHKIRDEYPVEFWVVFWGELLWQAWSYITLMKRQISTIDRRLTYRLPFSFTKTDWRNYSQRELATVLNALYQIDHLVKNTPNCDYSLELLLFKFVHGAFKPQQPVAQTSSVTRASASSSWR